MSAKRRALIFLAVACFTSQTACWRRPKPAELKSPYQRALEAYYRAVDQDQPDFTAALTAANALVAKNPADLEARSLRTQISLRMLKPLDPVSRTPLIRDLAEITRNIGAQPVSAWVTPRAWTTGGDMLVLVGSDRTKSLNSAGAAFDRLDAFRLYALFDAARSFYAQAGAVAAGTTGAVTAPLAREAAGARDGYARATEAAMNALSFVDPPLQNPVTRAKRRALLIELKNVFEKGVIAQPKPGVVSLEALDHQAQRSLYVKLAVETRQSLRDWCRERTATTAAREGEDLLSSWRDACERALVHAELHRLLYPQAADDVTEAQDLEYAYDNSNLERACGSR